MTRLYFELEALNYYFGNKEINMLELKISGIGK